MKYPALSLIALAAVWPAAGEAQIVPKPFDPPPRTDWAPEGCRSVPTNDPILPSRVGWRNLHSDTVSSDEISSALPPVYRADWVAEADQYHTTGPVFDSEGNLYASPLIPLEPVVLVSLDPNTGMRRWSIPNTTGAPPASAPMILRDPDNSGEEIVYVPLYDRAVAVRTDGTIVWDVPTGLTQTGTFSDILLGINYLPAADAVVGLTNDGFIYALDRATGAPLLSAPYQLPGERSPSGGPSALPPDVLAASDVIFRSLVDLPPGSTIGTFASLLLGNNNEVANHFSIEPRSGRIFVAATAPDSADGTVDGVSELGAIYGLDLVPEGSGYAIEESCSRFFAGGSASTPTLRTDGTRLYVGDNDGRLIAINPDCTDAWELDLGTQIFGSIAASSDNAELYAASAAGIFKVIDEGDRGVLEWTAALDVFEIPPALQATGFQNLNLNLVGIGANGIFVQAGAGVLFGSTALPVNVGIAQLDRETGAVRWFAEGLEETVAVMSIGPDGALYVGNSPLRRIYAFVLSQSGTLPPTGPVTGGIRKWAPERLDLLARDATCAAADRARNAATQCDRCRDSARADATQVKELIEQALVSVDQAAEDGDLSDRDRKVVRLKLRASRFVLKLFGVRGLPVVEKLLGHGCEVLDE